MKDQTNTPPDSQQRAGRMPWVFVTLACLLYLAQALPLLQTRWVEDESWQSIPAYALLTEGRIRNPTFAATDSEFTACVKPPAHTLLLAPVFKLFGVGVVPARVPSVLAGLGVVILTFLFGRELAGPTVGAVSAGLVAADNFLFLAARTARPEVFLAFCGLLAAFLVLRSRGRRSVRLCVVGGLAIGAAMLFHPNGAATLAATGGLFIAQHGLAFWRDRRLWAFSVTVIAIAAAFYGWAHSTPAHAEAFAATYSRAERVPFLTKLRGESVRYADYLGVSNQRFKLPIRVPLRAPVAAVVLVAVAILAWKNRPALTVLAILTIPYLLWWVYTINKTARYFAILAPVFAVAIALAAAIVYRNLKWRKLAIAVCALGALSQLAGNLLIVYKFRKADYTAVGTDLRRVIPPHESVYGALTFWMALRDRTYYSYDRMPFEYAITKRHPHYMILNDRVMTKGMGRGQDDWADLRRQANAFVRLHGELVGQVSNPFYGDLEIWRITYPRSSW